MKYLILGAGPAGLTVANQLQRSGETSFLVLEKEEEAGGLCRSRMVDGAPLDIGGGHFLDTRNQKVDQFLFSFLPEEKWNRFKRISQINVNGNVIDHPMEANIWQFDIESQVEYLKSIAAAGCNQEISAPEDFVGWIYWKLGNKIAEDYMIPYNQKMFSKELDGLGTYWMEKLPDVSFENTLRSCLEKKAYGIQPGHAEFFYPKEYGYGEVWRRMAEDVRDHIQYHAPVNAIDFESRTVNGKYQGETIISTIPWTCYEELSGMPERLQEKIKRLKHSSVQIEYRKGYMKTKAHWIYYPDKTLPYHRILVRHNFCPSSSGYWTETNKERIVGTGNENCFMNEYAYPLNTVEKPKIMEELLEWTKRKHVYGLGRWGEWKHYNSDVVVEKGIRLAKEVMGS